MLFWLEAVLLWVISVSLYHIPRSVLRIHMKGYATYHVLLWYMVSFHVVFFTALTAFRCCRVSCRGHLTSVALCGFSVTW